MNLKQLKEQKYNYVVDMSEKPQDSGTINQLCLERSKRNEMLN